MLLFILARYSELFSSNSSSSSPNWFSQFYLVSTNSIKILIPKSKSQYNHVELVAGGQA